jgi:phosphoribosyl-AMP cyclohydrolase
MMQQMARAADDILGTLVFDGNGLVPAIAQQHDTGEVLMLAWMDRQAVARTLETGEAWYWSRSRNKLWRKGETSGQTQTLVDFRLDCDADAVLLLVNQKGVACHTGRRSCFFRAPRGKFEIAAVETDPRACTEPIRRAEADCALAQMPVAPVRSAGKIGSSTADEPLRTAS